MFEVGKYFVYINGTAIYKVHRVEGTTAWLTWRYTDPNRPVYLRDQTEPFRWNFGGVSPNRYFHCDENGNRLPELEASRHVVVYMAYLKHRVRETELPLSATSEEKLEALIRAHDNRFEVVAKKKIKFTI